MRLNYISNMHNNKTFKSRKSTCDKPKEKKLTKLEQKQNNELSRDTGLEAFEHLFYMLFTTVFEGNRLEEFRFVQAEQNFFLKFENDVLNEYLAKDKGAELCFYTGYENRNYGLSSIHFNFLPNNGGTITLTLNVTSEFLHMRELVRVLTRASQYRLGNRILDKDDYTNGSEKLLKLVELLEFTEECYGIRLLFEIKVLKFISGDKKDKCGIYYSDHVTFLMSDFDENELNYFNNLT